MKRFFFACLFLFTGGLDQHVVADSPEGVTWKGTVREGFSAEIALSKTKMTLEELLVVTITLTYPQGYQTDLDSLRRHLVKQVGLSEPPFTIVGEKIKEGEEGRLTIAFSLDPQLTGTHVISFYQIPFIPLDPQEDNPVAIISEIFPVSVSAPPIKTNFLELTPPLLTLTEKNPIVMSFENRKQLIDNPFQHEKEASRNLLLFRKRSLPWGLGLFAGIFLLGLPLLVFIARRQLKQKKKK